MDDGGIITMKQHRGEDWKMKKERSEGGYRNKEENEKENGNNSSPSSTKILLLATEGRKNERSSMQYLPVVACRRRCVPLWMIG